MKPDKRHAPRYSNIGRVEAFEICPLAGVMDDINEGGCKVHFPIPVTIDMEGEFKLTIRVTHKSVTNPFTLIAHPQWVKNEGNQTYAGFVFLRSPGTPELLSFIEVLKEEQEETMDDDDLIIESCAELIK